MAASWGLAFQYGKKAYEDMWRDQEQNERLAASRELYDMQIAEAEKAQAMQSVINDEVRQGQEIITKYKKQMAKGGEDGVRAYAEAMTAVGIPTQYLGNGTVGSVRADGQIDPSSIRTMTGDGWSGTAIVSEFQKIVPSAEGMSAEYRAAMADNINREWEKEKFQAQLASQMGMASIYANARLAAANAQAGALREAIFADQWYKNNDVLEAYANDGAARSAMGNDTRVVVGEDGIPNFMKYNSEEGWIPYNPTESELQSFTNDKGRILTEGYNLMVTNGVPGQVAIYNTANLNGAARQYGMSIFNDIQNFTNDYLNTVKKQAREASRQAAADSAQSKYISHGNWWSPLLYPGILY